MIIYLEFRSRNVVLLFPIHTQLHKYTMSLSTNEIIIYIIMNSECVLI